MNSSASILKVPLGIVKLPYWLVKPTLTGLKTSSTWASSVKNSAIWIPVTILSITKMLLEVAALNAVAETSRL